MMATTFLATSEKPGRRRSGLSAVRKPLQNSPKKADAGVLAVRGRLARRANRRGGWSARGSAVKTKQCGQPLVAHQHQEGASGKLRIGGSNSLGCFRWRMAVGRKRLPWVSDLRQRFGRQALDGIAVDAGDSGGFGIGHPAFLRDFPATRHRARICEDASSVSGTLFPHLPQAAVSVGDNTAGRLRSINAAPRKPSEDAVSVPSGRSGRPREIP